MITVRASAFGLFLVIAVAMSAQFREQGSSRRAVAVLDGWTSIVTRTLRAAQLMRIASDAALPIFEVLGGTATPQ